MRPPGSPKVSRKILYPAHEPEVVGRGSKEAIIGSDQFPSIPGSQGHIRDIVGGPLEVNRPV